MSLIRRYVPLLIVLISLIASAYQLITTISLGAWRNPSDEMVTKWEDRLQALREALPDGVTKVGYVDDAFLAGDPSQLDVNEFQLMQYSVAPVAIQAGVEYEWIIGNFNENDTLEARLTETLGAYELQSFGFGLYLIHDVEN